MYFVNRCASTSSVLPISISVHYGYICTLISSEQNEYVGHAIVLAKCLIHIYVIYLCHNLHHELSFTDIDSKSLCLDKKIIAFMLS